MRFVPTRPAEGAGVRGLGRNPQEGVEGVAPEAAEVVQELGQGAEIAGRVAAAAAEGRGGAEGVCRWVRNYEILFCVDNSAFLRFFCHIF